VEDTAIDVPVKRARGRPKGSFVSKDKEKEEGVKGESKSTVDGSAVIPESLNVEHFKAVWKDWLDHLRQKRKPATLHAQDLQLAKLSEMGIPKAIATLKHCIEKNWQGIYEPRQESNMPTVPPRPKPVPNAHGILPLRMEDVQ